VPAELPLETFAALDTIPGVIHAFTGKVPGLDVKVDRELALERLEEHHAAARMRLRLAPRRMIVAEQIHGRDVAAVDASTIVPVPGVDGLVTSDPTVCLGIYVADCCAVYLVDPVRRVIGLVHSGRKGSELGISGAAIGLMRSRFGSDPVVQLSPCIRPPNYEVDFAAIIAAECRAAGVRNFHDSGTCTAANIERYYSYRAEKGRTGRMLALLAIDEAPAHG
jgi:polyphenol oxidase